MFCNEASTLAQTRDNIRRTNPTDPTISDLNKKINCIQDEFKKNKWLEHLKSATFCQGPGNLWKTIKNLNNPSKTKGNNIINISTAYACQKNLINKLIPTPSESH